MKEAKIQSLHIVWFQLYGNVQNREVFRERKQISGCQGMVEGGNRSDCLISTSFCLGWWKYFGFSGDGYTTLWMYLKILYCTFYVVCELYIKENMMAWVNWNNETGNIEAADFWGTINRTQWQMWFEDRERVKGKMTWEGLEVPCNELY